jgi:hypothetical protein
MLSAYGASWNKKAQIGLDQFAISVIIYTAKTSGENVLWTMKQ